MKNLAIVVGAVLALVPASWGSDHAPKKFHASSAPAHHSVEKADKTGHASAPSPVEAKSVSARQAELNRLEHQTVKAPAQSARNSSSAAQAPHVHPETGHSANIKFNYHTPRNQSTRGTAHRK